MFWSVSLRTDAVAVVLCIFSKNYNLNILSCSVLVKFLAKFLSNLRRMSVLNPKMFLESVLNGNFNVCTSDSNLNIRSVDLLQSSCSFYKPLVVTKL